MNEDLRPVGSRRKPCPPASVEPPMFRCQQCDHNRPRWQRIVFQGHTLCLKCTEDILVAVKDA